MKRLPFAAAILLLLQGGALATPFDGNWFFVCLDKAGMVDVQPTVIEGNTIRGYESECEVTRIEPVGTRNEAWRVTSACAGEGERWTDDSLYALEHDSEDRIVQLIEIDMTDGWVQSYRTCK